MLSIGSQPEATTDAIDDPLVPHAVQLAVPSAAAASGHPCEPLLVLACSPDVSPLANVIDEALEVNDECPGTIRRGGTCERLAEALTKHSPRSFLFSGHADAATGMSSGRTLGFTMPGGGLSVVTDTVVAQTLAAHAISNGGRLELVFINGCSSYDLGMEVLSVGVPCVVCWRTKVKDGAARVFALAFFRHLRQSGAPADYRAAFAEAKLAVSRVTRPGRLGTGVASEVQRYVVRDPRQPLAVGQFTFTPPPEAAGIPVLLPED